jgi:dihydrofolate reductase
MPRVHVFVGASLDGFIAGPNDELDWLGGGEGETPDSFGPFFATIGCVLMGRRTYDIVDGFASGAWPYGDTPLLVATKRALSTKRTSVRAVKGSIEEMIAHAKEVAGARDVYVDGGQLIRSTLDAGLVDAITVTVVPIVLGAGIPLFAGVKQRHRLTLTGQRTVGGAAVELKYEPQR